MQTESLCYNNQITTRDVIPAKAGIQFVIPAQAGIQLRLLDSGASPE
jgi:hypothetical protein